MNFSVTTPAPRDAWHQVCASDPDSLVTQSPEWLDCLCELRGFTDVSRLYESGDGTRIVLPLARRRPAVGGLAILESMPSAWGFGGPVSNRPLTEADLGAVIADLRGLGAMRVHLRPNPLHSTRWEGAVGPRVVAVPRRAHVVDLRGGFDAVLGNFKAVTRRGARKAERCGVTVEHDTTGRLIGEFDGLFRRSVTRWAGKQHEPVALAQWRAARRDPLDKFEALAAKLGPAFHLWVARLRGEPVAAIIVLQGRNAHYTRGAMNEELARECDANSLLHRVAIEAACEAGCASYHMGESGSSGGLSFFKARFGARPHPYAEYRLERLPLTRAEQAAKQVVKRVIGFRDVVTPARPGGDASVTPA